MRKEDAVPVPEMMIPSSQHERKILCMKKK